MFHDRCEAGRQLAVKLDHRVLVKPLVLAIPRGGVLTGAALAQEIGAELDVVLSRKLRAPHQRELAIGAIGENGDVYSNEDVAEALNVSDEYFHREKEQERATIARSKEHIRRVRPKAPITGRSVIVTDDGIATGATMIAALQAVRSQNPAELIVATPVVPADRIHDLELHCDQVICLLPARHFATVGQFYEDFPAVDDEQVLQILRQFAPQVA